MACSRSFINNILLAGTKCVWKRAVYRTHQSSAHHQESRVSSLVEREPIPLDDLKVDPFSSANSSTQLFVDDIRPPLKRSFNLAAYVNTSETLQELIKLGVSLYDIENTNIKAAQKLVMLDFGRDCAPYIKLLVAHGLKTKNLGRFISEFPDIFSVPLDDLEIRIKYLKSKGFSKKHISTALNRSSQIISNNVKSLDFKLGEFQIEFGLPASIIRNIVSKYPPIIRLPSGQYKMINFTLREEFGFENREIHTILEEQPKILDILRPVLIERLELIHNTIGLSHEIICTFPKLLTGPVLDIRHRSMYLKKLARNQFDPSKPLYVPPSALYNGSDEQFCERYAKTNIEDYKLFLKFC